MTDQSEVSNFYAGKTLFITGGTGFVGICLIEKILRSLPGVDKIYLLLRPKKGKEISQRLEEISKNKIFEKLLEKSSPDIFKKLVAVAGEIGEDGLGLSPEDRKTLIENVNIVFHSAATLDFEQNLRPTVNINLLGTRRVMDLCKEMKKIQSVVHVSSAFVNSYQLECEEILYPAPKDADKVINLATTLTDPALEALEPKLLENHPNTYTFTKHLAEHEVDKCASLFPCTIVRPSMITGAWKEPVPGWTISKNGPQGFLMGASRGVVRRLPIALDLICDYIPVDVVVNELIVAAFKASKDGLTIYHCTSSTINPFRWRGIDAKINTHLNKYPIKGAVWYPRLKFNTSVTTFKISAAFVHFIPGFFLDLVSRLCGQKPILIRLHKNVNSSINRLERFIYTEWKFDNSKTMQLSKSLNETDKGKFFIDIKPLDWHNYFENLHLGVRRYLNNEPIENLAAAKSKNTVLMLLHLAFKAMVLFGFWYLISCVMGVSMKQAGWTVPICYVLLNLL